MCRRLPVFATVIACFITGIIASTWWSRYSYVPAPIIAQEEGLLKLFPVKVNGKLGCIDDKGKWLHRQDRQDDLAAFELRTDSALFHLPPTTSPPDVLR